MTYPASTSHATRQQLRTLLSLRCAHMPMTHNHCYVTLSPMAHIQGGHHLVLAPQDNNTAQLDRSLIIRISSAHMNAFAGKGTPHQDRADFETLTNPPQPARGGRNLPAHQFPRTPLSETQHSPSCTTPHTMIRSPRARQPRRQRVRISITYTPDPQDVDTTDPTGLTAESFDRIMDALINLAADDIKIKIETDDVDGV